MHASPADIPDGPFDIPSGEAALSAESLVHQAHRVIQRSGSDGRIPDDGVEHGSEQLALQMSACAVVAELPRRSFGNKTHPFGRNVRISRAAYIAPDQFFQVSGARR